MPNQVFPVLCNELAKAIRRKLPYFGFLAIGLVCVAIYFVGGQINTAATANAWGYTSFSMQMVFSDIGPIFIVVFSAMLLSEETGTGTIRAALAAPVHRWELFIGKAFAGLIYMMALSAVALLFSAAFAKIHFRFGPVGDSFGVVYSGSYALQQLLLGCVLSWIPLSALVMYGLLVSVLVCTAGAAVAVAISTLFLIDFTKHLVGLDPYIFTRYINYPWLTLQQLAQAMDFQWRPEVWKMMRLAGVSAVVSFVAGLVIFVRQDLNH